MAVERSPSFAELGHVDTWRCERGPANAMFFTNKPRVHSFSQIMILAIYAVLIIDLYHNAE